MHKFDNIMLLSSSLMLNAQLKYVFLIKYQKYESQWKKVDIQNVGKFRSGLFSRAQKGLKFEFAIEGIIIVMKSLKKSSSSRFTLYELQDIYQAIWCYRF